MCACACRQLRDVTKERDERHQAHDQFLSQYMAANKGLQQEQIVAQERAAEQQNKMLELENECKMLKVSRVRANHTHEQEKAKAKAEAVWGIWVASNASSPRVTSSCAAKPMPLPSLPLTVWPLIPFPPVRLQAAHAKHAAEEAARKGMDEQLRQSKARIAADIQEHFDETLAMMERANLEEKTKLEEMLKKKEEEIEKQKKVVQDAAADDDGTGMNESEAFLNHDLKLPITMLDHMLTHRECM